MAATFFTTFATALIIEVAMVLTLVIAITVAIIFVYLFNAACHKTAVNGTGGTLLVKIAFAHEDNINRYTAIQDYIISCHKSPGVAAGSCPYIFAQGNIPGRGNNGFAGIKISIITPTLAFAMIPVTNN